MGYMDRVEDCIDKHMVKVIAAPSIDRVNIEYKRFRKLSLHRLSILSDDNSLSIDEMKAKYYYSVLDKVLYIYDDKVEVEPDIFVNFLKSDAGLTQFCKEHTEHDGIIGVLKYKHQIGNKKVVLKQALQLASQG